MRRPLLIVLATLVGTVAAALAQMPDVSQMSGVPLPTGDLPDGTMSVRVVRGDMSNNVPGQTVELHGGVQTLSAVTDGEGRATFSGIAPGTQVHAVTTVDGNRLESQNFPVPATGGIRVMLVAPAAAGAGVPSPSVSPAAPAAPAGPGTITFGGQSRFIVEIVEEALEVYVLMDVVHGQQGAVTTEAPLIFEVPPGAEGLTVLEGSSPQAKAEGDRVVVTGPFGPGRTIVQFAYRLPYGGGRESIRQVLPAPLMQTSLMVRKIGEVQFSSPQAVSQREMPSAGQIYYLATGPGIPAGGALEVSLSGLPYHSRIPRYVALALVLGIVGVGVWAGASDESAATEAQKQKLEARREQLFGELVKLEEQHLAGRGDPVRYQVKRRDIVAQLEQVYARLDDLAPLVAAGGLGTRQGEVPAEAPLRTHRA